MASDDEITRFSECYFYDYDLKELSSSFDSLYKVFRRIKKRAERRSTLQISKSVFDYYEKKQDLKVTPWKYYDFRYNDYRICIWRYRQYYSVVCVGFEYPQESRRDDIWLGAGLPYGKFESYVEAVPLFDEIVYWFIHNVITSLDVDEVTF